MKNIVGVVTILSGIAVSLCNAVAQQPSKGIPRIGFISATGSLGNPSPLVDAFLLGLRELGYLHGKNVLIETRYSEGKLDRTRTIVTELIQEKFDAIVAANNVAILVAKDSTKTIPIVIISSIDPVSAGYVESFAQPGGNITGLAWLNRDISSKRIELLKEMLPKMSKIAILWDADGPGPSVAIREYEAAARAFGYESLSLRVRGPNPDFAEIIQNAAMARANALVVVGNPLMAQNARHVLTLATKHHLPSMTERSTYVSAGGLISYGANFADLHRRAAAYVVDILKGANPANLRVKLAEKFEIHINLKTSQQLGLVMPKNILVQADKVVR